MNKKPRTSSMWSYFQVVDSNLRLAKCDMCGAKLSYKSTLSNLKNHIVRKHPTVSLSCSTASSTAPKPTNAQDSITPPAPVVQNQTTNTNRLIPTSSRGTLSSFLPTSRARTPEIDDPGTPDDGPSFSSAPGPSTLPTVQTTDSAPQPIQTTRAPPGLAAVQTQLDMIRKRLPAGNKRKIDRCLLRLFTLDLQPFSVVEDTGFKNFVHSLNPNYNLPDRKTISNSLIPAAYEECKNKVIEKMCSVESVCLTTDCWSSSAQESYIAVTAHFLTSDFVFESVLLDCCQIEGSHTSLHLAETIKSITDKYNLTDKVMMVVTDNGANIKAAVKNNLKWPHFGCYAHSLNLIVNDGLEESGALEMIAKIKIIVRHFKRSNQDTEKLLKYQRDSGESNPKKCIMDVVTRWNSTYHMIARFVLLEKAIRSTLGLIDKQLDPLTADEWKAAADLCKVLKPFEDVTKKLSGEKYVSGSHIILLTTGLTDVCQKLIRKPLHMTALNLAHKLQEGILTRFANLESNKVIGLASFLDPRFKLYPFSSSSAQTSIKEHVKRLATAENNSSQRETTAAEAMDQPNDMPEDEDSELSVTSYFDAILKKAQPTGSALSTAIVEVNRYVEERTIDKNDDPLKWWEMNERLYPTLSKIVKKKFCMVATSVPCERIFSKTGLFVSDRRTRLKASKVQQLIFLNANNKFWG